MELMQARQSALDLVTPGGVERVELGEGLGRVLGEQIIALENVPQEARSRLDGFALRSGDVSGASPASGVDLAILPGLLAAGHDTQAFIETGQCIRILTGAPLPHGADAVAAQERTVRDGRRLRITDLLKPGAGVTGSGADIRAGDVVLSKGEILTPTRLALIAALGCETIAVHRRPRVALLATGDEVKEPGQPLEGPWTYCNNRLLLGWLVRQQGGEPIHLGVARDDMGAIVQRLDAVDADLVITTGGIGRGDRDLILDAWKKLGVATVFRQINLSPGKNTALGVRDKTIFWAFPGNPWAGQVLFQELAAPVLRRRQGLASPCDAAAIAARLGRTIKKTGGLYKAVRGFADLDSFPPTFIPAAGKNESLGATLKKSFAYAILESHVVEAAQGSVIRMRLHDLPLEALPLFGMLGGMGKGAPGPGEAVEGCPDSR